jgi:hypothetical protein
MKPSNETMTLFYQQLGKLFYGIAAVDKTVREEEIKELKKIVKEQWLPVEDSIDQFGSDSGFQIEIVFDWLVENDWDFEQILPDFKFFRSEHESLFSPEVNRLILNTASAIANSFSGKNKSEHRILSELKTILQENKWNF